MFLDLKKKKLFDAAYDSYLKISNDIEELYKELSLDPFADEVSLVDLVCSLDLFIQGTLVEIGLADNKLSSDEIEFIKSIPDGFDELCEKIKGYRHFINSLSEDNQSDKAQTFFEENASPYFLAFIKDNQPELLQGIFDNLETIVNSFIAIDDEVSETENELAVKILNQQKRFFLKSVEPQPPKNNNEKSIAFSIGSSTSEELSEMLEELNDLVGLEGVKREVLSNINLIKVNSMRKDKGLPPLQISNHMVFTGQPGTGKTTVARIIAKIYKALGVVSKGQLVETDRAGMVAGYVGQTALKTAQVIKRAKGGVLFIDEAYALNSIEGSNDYGKEAIDTLVKGMEDFRDDLVVIVAGYTDEMKDFIEMNPGLKSRFNKYISFDNYTSEEMLDIFKKLCEKNQFILSDEASECAKAYFGKNCGDVTFGNARGVRNLFDRVVTIQASRIVDEQDLSDDEFRTILGRDLLACS